MDASPDQLLVSRLVDDVAADASWDAFCEMAEERPGLWRTLAEAQRDQTLLAETVSVAAGIADRVPAPVRRARIPAVALTWSGWAAAVLALAVLVMQPLAPTPGSMPVQRASLADLSPAEALRAYINKGKEAGHVIEEYPSKMLVDVRPDPTGGGYRLIYFRPILEQTRVPDLFEVSGQDDRGNPRFVRYEPPPRRPF